MNSSVRDHAISSRPLEMFWNPVEVVNLEVKDAIKLDSNHLLVVYRQEEGHIDRRIVQGPAVFMPDAHEWWVNSVVHILMLIDTVYNTVIGKINALLKECELPKI